MRFHDAFTQILIVGGLAFCCPGMFNAMTGLGGAGSVSENASAIANATLYGCFAVFGYFGGAFFNTLGNKILMGVGGLTYCIYAAGMYIIGQHEGTEWLAGIVGALLGFGAGWFWTSQGAMMMAYSTTENKGYYISVFWVIFNLGGMMGGILSFALNFNATEAVSANAASYFAFVGIMGVGALGAFFLLVHPSKVVRADNEPVVFEKSNAVAEIKGAISVTCHRAMILLTIPFIASNWFYTYQFQGFNRYIFNIRTRGFNSALYWGSQMLGSYALGWLLDWKKYSTKKRGFMGLLVMAFFTNLGYVLGAVIQMSFEGGFDRGSPPGGRYIDLSESGRYWFPCIVYLIYAIGDAMIQTYIYWLMANMAGTDTALCARYAGYYKGTQSLGAAIAWGLDLGIDYVAQFWICWALILISMPLFVIVNREMKEPELKGSGELKESNPSRAVSEKEMEKFTETVN